MTATHASPAPTRPAGSRPTPVTDLGLDPTAPSISTRPGTAAPAGTPAQR